MQEIKVKCFLSVVTILLIGQSQGQRYLSDYDSSLFLRDTVTTVIKRLENLTFSGYIQPQFQVAQSKGSPSYGGGNFSRFSNNRFILRRARIKVDYQIPAKGKKLPYGVFTFQIDATERGAFVRDMFIRLYEPKSQNFSFTTGLFARPFGYEVNLSSGVRETPERGRMSQILMPTERDLGAMVTYDHQSGKTKSFWKWDIGVFNGQGLAAVPSTDFDSYKDIISRFTLKPLPFSKTLSLSGGLSFLYGGLREDTVVYEIEKQGNKVMYVGDTNVSNYGKRAPKEYYGADVQLAYKHSWGKTELRAEYWQGKQPGTSASTFTPGILLAGPTYIRNFNGAFFYFLQNIINRKNEIMLKYDWYDPDTEAKGMEIGEAGTNLNSADIKFSTVGFGYTHYFNDNLKVLFYYDIVRNEKTALTDARDNTDIRRDFSKDIKDNILTCRFQLRF